MNTLAVPPKVNTSESNVPITFKHKLETKDPTTFFSHLCDLYDSKDPHHFLIEYLGRFCSNVSNGLLNANVAIKLPKHRDDWFEISWTDPGWTSDDVKRWLEYIHDSTGKMDNISRKHEGGRSVLAAMMARHKDACEMRIKVIEDTELPKGRNNLGDNIMHKGWYLYTYNGDHQGWREPNGEFIGEDPNREGLIETPKRVIKAFKEYFKGYHQDAEADLSKTFGDVEGYDDMVVEKNITLESHCEHHMAPIIGVAHVAYIPNKKVVGLSKLARTVEVFSKRLQTQERLTMQVAKTLMNALDAKGVAVTVDAAHQCMTMRGIKKEKATTVTNYFLGSFREDLSIQNRYLRYIAK